MEMEKIRPFVEEHKPLHEMLPLSEPLFLSIRISDSCNFKCRFCYNSVNEIKDGSLISLDFYKKLISDLSDFEGQVDTLLIGGDVEPLQHPEFTDFIKIARNSGKVKTLKMSTNVSLLTPELARDIISSGIDIVQISINGMSNEHYKYITNCDVDFNMIKGNVEYLHSIKENAHIHIKCIGDYFSEEQKAEFFSVFSPLCDSINIERLVNQWLDIELDIKSGVNRFDLHNAKSSSICSRPFYLINVHHNGNVNCCPASIKTTFALANANTSSLFDIWKGKALYELRMAFLRGNYQSKCHSCSMCKFTEFQTSENLTPYREVLLEKYEKLGCRGMCV